MRMQNALLLSDLYLAYNTALKSPLCPYSSSDGRIPEPGHIAGCVVRHVAWFATPGFGQRANHFFKCQSVPVARMGVSAAGESLSPARFFCVQLYQPQASCA